MENLNPPPLTLAFSARAASQEITVPSDATKKTFTIHSYRDTVQPSWNPSGTIQSGTIYLYKGNLSPSDFSGGILIELTLGTEINGYVKKAMIRVKVN